MNLGILTMPLGGSKSKSKNSSKSKKNTRTQKINHKAYVIGMRISIMLIALGLLLIGFWQVSKAYEGKIFPRVTIAGLKVGGKSPTEARKIVASYIEEINKKGPEITYDNQTLQPKLSEIGATFNLENAINDAYSFGRNGTLGQKVKENSFLVLKDYDVPLSPKIDEKKLDEYLSQIAKVVEIAPENANLTLKSGQITLNSSKAGRGLDKNKFKNDLAAFINQESKNNKITLITSVLEPSIKEAGTQDAKAQAEKYMAAAPITLAFEDQTYVISREEIGSWVVFSEDGAKLKADISGEKLGGYVGWVSSKIEIQAEDKVVEAGTGNVQAEGKDGRGVDTQSLSNQIRERVLAGNGGKAIAIGTFVVTRGEKTVYPSFTPGMFPGRWIDVNLSEQMLRTFEGDKLVGEFQVSTGKWSMPTPTGVRYIESKDPRAWSSKYGLYMPFWNSIGGGYGIHELPEWPSGYKEGEGHLGIPVSHGCIRLGVGPAEFVYNWAPIGTPVNIHYSD